MSCQHARDDGAYVLGALAPSERAVFEGHLAGCPPCRNAVAELAALPGLLARLDAASAERVVRATNAAEQVAGPPEAADSSRLPRLLRAAAQARRRDLIGRRWRTALAGLAAACLAVLVGFGVSVVQRPDRVPPPDGPVAMVPMVPAVATSTGSVTAEIGLTGVTGGTRVRMHCAYANGGEYRKPYTFRLVAYGAGGEVEQVGSWQAGPGDELSVEGMTRFAPDGLRRLELQRTDGSALLVYTVA